MNTVQLGGEHLVDTEWDNSSRGSMGQGGLSWRRWAEKGVSTWTGGPAPSRTVHGL